jgi:glucosamine kinase
VPVGNTVKKVFLIMGNWKHVIADSGGSTTSWAFCGVGGSVEYRETTGLHPKSFLTRQPAELELLRQHLGDVTDVKLQFYGAGCAQPATQEAMAIRLKELGFGDVSVFPDTLGACRATCGTTPGTVAILGTGSILVEFDGQAIVNRVGGYGNLIGDEGSGFHFARLVLRDYLDRSPNLSVELQTLLSGIVGTFSEVLHKLALPEAQQWIARLGGKLAGLPLGDYHRSNLDAFLSAYLQQARSTDRILHVVGSYGYYQQEIVCRLLVEKGWQPGVILRNPIEQLVEFHR